MMDEFPVPLLFPLTLSPQLPGTLGQAGLLEGGQGGRDGGGRADDIGDRVQRLQPVTGVEDHGLGLGVELTGREQLAQHARPSPRRRSRRRCPRCGPAAGCRR